MSVTHKFKTYHYYKKKRPQTNLSYFAISKEYPQFISYLLKDLSQLEGYTDIAIGFASGVQLDIIRKILSGDVSQISRKVFLDILGLYARVFCDWFHYKDEKLS